MSLEEGSLEVPCSLIRDDEAGVFLVSLYVYAKISGAKTLVVGVDPGASFTGVVAILDGYIVYRGVFHSLERLTDAIVTAADLMESVTVYVGESRVAAGLIEKLRSRGISVHVVPEDVPGRSLEYLGWKKENRHVRDALKIALAGMYMELKGHGRGGR